MANVRSACPTLSLLHILGKRWIIPIIELLCSPRRNMQFNTMQLLLGGITPKNLSRSLKDLADAKIVKRIEVRRNDTMSTIYALTDRGVAIEEFISRAKKLGIEIYDVDASCINRKCNDCILARS
jgi:DNA-binding HxlR family transcriptional regulator